jgi:hypothetical protein
MIQDEMNDELQQRIYKMTQEKIRNDTFVGGPNEKYQSAFMGGSHYGAIRMKEHPDRYSGYGIEGAPIPMPESQLQYSEELLSGGSMNYTPGSNGSAFGTNRDSGYEPVLGFKGSGHKRRSTTTMVDLERMGRPEPTVPVLNSAKIGSSLSGFGRPKGSKNKKKECELEGGNEPMEPEPKGTVGYETALDLKNKYYQKGKRASEIMDRYMKAKKEGMSTLLARGKPPVLNQTKRMVGGVLPIFSALSFLGKAFAGDILEGLLSPNKQRAIQQAIDDARKEGKAEGMKEGLELAQKERIYSGAKAERAKQKIAEAPQSENVEHLIEEVQQDKATESAIKDLQKQAKQDVVSTGAGKKVDGRKVRGQYIAKLMKEKKMSFGEASKEYSRLKGSGFFSDLTKKAVSIGSKAIKGAISVAKKGKELYDKLPEEAKTAIKDKAKKVGKKAIKKILSEPESEEEKKYDSESDVKPTAEPEVKGAGKKRTLNPRMAKRMLLVKKIMASKKLSMINASKFIVSFQVS